jgi:hypothetical protein
MKVTTLFLLCVAALFFGFGTAYFLHPEEMAALSGVQLTSTPAKIDVWAIYAGVQIGFGAFLLRSALTHFATDAALLMVAYIVGGIALLRTMGIFYYASFDMFSLGALAFEGPTAIIAWLLFLKHQNRKRNLSDLR